MSVGAKIVPRTDNLEVSNDTRGGENYSESVDLGTNLTICSHTRA